ncbi:MAG: DUF3617 family protein [Acidobacteriota bacterium]
MKVDVATDDRDEGVVIHPSDPAGSVAITPAHITLPTDGPMPTAPVPLGSVHRHFAALKFREGSYDHPLGSLSGYNRSSIRPRTGDPARETFMKIRITITSAAVSLLFMAAAVHGANRVNAGMWETTMITSTGTATPTKGCLSADQAAFINGDAEGLRKHVTESTAAKTKGRCAVKDVKVKDNQVTVTTACGKIENVITTTYSGDTYESVSTGGATIKGRRLGACP